MIFYLNSGILNYFLESFLCALQIQLKRGDHVESATNAAIEKVIALDYCFSKNINYCFSFNFNTVLIPINGNWSPWHHWSKCSAACNGGKRTRSRPCDSPFPAHGGKPCEGVAFEEELCNNEACPSKCFVCTQKLGSRCMTLLATKLASSRTLVSCLQPISIQKKPFYRSSSSFNNVNFLHK